MSQIGYSLPVEAPPSVVWGLLTDVSGFPRWMSGVRDARLMDGAFLGKGAQLELRGRGGRHYLEVVEFQQERLIALQLRFKYPFILRLIHAYGVQSQGESTQVTLVELYGGLMGFSMRWLMGRLFKRKILGTLLSLRDVAQAIYSG